MPDDNTGEQTGGVETPQWARDLQNSMTNVGTGISELVNLAKQNVQETRRASAALNQPTEDDTESTDILAEKDLELLPRKQFAQKLLESFEGSLDKALKPLKDQIDTNARQTIQSVYLNEAEKFAGKTPDFAEWADEMAAIAEQNPNLPISRIYAIAKAEAPPKKLSEVAERYKLKDTTAEPPKTGKAKPPLSITPHSSSSEVKNQRMNADDASKAAWEESIAKFGNPFA